MLHRDVKPANVLLTAEGEPLLADFNIGCCSKVEGAGPSAFFGGTLPYMAPEHIDAFNPDHDRGRRRAWTAGPTCSAWRSPCGSCSPGTNPFGIEYLRGTWPETLEALAAQRRTGPPPEAVADRPRRATCPGSRRCCCGACHPDPDGRPATAGEMARELELCLKPATRALVRPAPAAGGRPSAATRS